MAIVLSEAIKEAIQKAYDEYEAKMNAESEWQLCLLDTTYSLLCRINLKEVQFGHPTRTDPVFFAAWGKGLVEQTGTVAFVALTHQEPWKRNGAGHRQSVWCRGPYGANLKLATLQLQQGMSVGVSNYFAEKAWFSTNVSFVWPEEPPPTVRGVPIDDGRPSSIGTPLTVGGGSSGHTKLTLVLNHAFSAK